MRILEVRAARSAPSRIGLGMSHHRIGSEMVFPEPHSLEAKFFGQNGLLSEVVQQTDGIRGFSRRAFDCRKGGKFHSCNLPLRQNHYGFRLF